MTTPIISEDLSSTIVYTPEAKQGPRFFVPSDRYQELLPVLRGIQRKYPHTVVSVGAEVLGKIGAVFGPEDDLDVDREIVEKLGIRVPGKAGTVGQSSSPERAGPRRPDTTYPGVSHQPDLSKPTGRGRPPKYPFRNMTYVGDHFLAVGATRPKMQATGCNFLTKSGLRGVVEFSYIRVARGVLVVVSETADGKSRYEADGSGDNE